MKLSSCVILKVIVIVVILIALPFVWLYIRPESQERTWIPLTELGILKPQPKQEPLPFKEGEKFVYDVKLGAFTIGSAQLTFQGRGKLDGQDVYVIVFEVNSTKVYDKETIYAQAYTFYPVRVERDVKVFGSSMKIQEDYDQDKNLVKIQKTEKGKTTTEVIQSDAKLHNIISLLYFYRYIGLKDGSALDFNLPTKKVNMRVSKVDDLRVPHGTYGAYLLASVPKKYKVWFDTSSDSIPLRIDGAVSFAGARMVLVEIH